MHTPTPPAANASDACASHYPTAANNTAVPAAQDAALPNQNSPLPHDPEGLYAARAAVAGGVSLVVVGDDGALRAALLATLERRPHDDVVVLDGRYGAGAYVVPNNADTAPLLTLRVLRPSFQDCHGLQKATCGVVSAGPTSTNRRRRVPHAAMAADQPLNLPADVQHAVAALAELVARARTPLPRGRLIDLPVIEPATPLARALGRVAVGAALLDGRITVTLDDLWAPARIALDSMPVARRLLLLDRHVAMETLPGTLYRRTAEGLALVGLMDFSHWGWLLTPLASKLLRVARLSS